MRGRHRARRDGRAARRAFAVLSGLVLTAGTLAGTASAGEIVPVPVGPMFVDTPDLNRVYGQIDGLAYLVGGTVGDQTPTIQTDMLNKVWGVVADPNGTVQSGVTVILELIPSDGYDVPAQVFELARTVTDTAGEFFMDVPTTDEVLAEAEYLNGTVNMMLTAVRYEATHVGLRAYLGAGAIYSSMVEYGPGVGGVAMAPLNVGVMTIEDVKAMTGTSGLAETPGNDPEDPNTVKVDQPDIFVAGTGAVAADNVPAVSEPYVEVPDGYTQTYVAYPPDLTEIETIEDADDRGGEGGGDNRCKHTANQGRWLVDHTEREERWQPVGEVHSIYGTKVKYTYSERANTQLGAGVKVEKGPWKISGSTSVTNDSGANVALPYMPDSFGRRVEAQFAYHYTRKTWCPQGYDEVDGPHALHTEEVVGKTWQGGLDYGSRDYSARDSRDEYEKATDEGRVAPLRRDAEWTKTKGKTFKYTYDVSAFGVSLNAESVNDINHTMVLKAGTSRDKWHIFGDIAAPTVNTNHAIYIYF